MASPESVILQNKQGAVGGNVINFPLDNRPHYMQLSFYKYQRTNPEVNPLSPPKDEIVQHVILPLPQQLADQYGIRYAGTEFGISGALAMGIGSAGMKMIDQIGTKDGPSLDDMKKEIGGVSLGGTARALMRRVASIDAGISGAIDRLTGVALNPHNITVFEGINLRSFQFSWKVYPQSPQDSRAIQSALKQIRRLIHPENYNDEGVRDVFLLRYPHEVFATIWVEEKALIRIGRSVISDLGINYAPSGTPAFFKGTHDPVELEFSITLQEVATLTQQEIDQLDDFPGRGARDTDTLEKLVGAP